MEEKEIIRGKKIDVKKMWLIASIIVFFISIIFGKFLYDNTARHVLNPDALEEFSKLVICIIQSAMLFSIPYLVLMGVLHLCLVNVEIVVTDKRVYGKALFGKRVDLPLDTISAVGTSSLKGIYVGTSAGKIYFNGIVNNIEIHSQIGKLLNDRQNKQEQAKSNNMSTTEELKQYKELLDSGVITQEEFE